MIADEITFEFAPAEALLFPAESVAMDSPRLAWMKRHDVHTRKNDDNDLPPWCAWFGTADPIEFLNTQGDAFGYGDDEDEALAALARYTGWLLWNEEAE